MDPFSITMGALGISETGLAAIKTLREATHGVMHASQEFREIRMVLGQTETSLNHLRGLEIGDRETSEACKAALKESGMVEAVNNCGKACEAFNERLQQWTRHSTKDEMSKRDQLSIGFWNKDSIAVFKTNVETCQQLVEFAVSTAQLSLQTKNARKSEKFMKDSENSQINILRSIQDLDSKLEVQIESVLKQREAPEQVLEGGSNQNTNSTHTLTNQGEVKSRFELLNNTAASLGVVASQLGRERSQLTIGKVTGHEEAMTVVGIPEGIAKAIDARIGDVKAGKKATTMVGVFPDGFSVNGMFKHN